MKVPQPPAEHYVWLGRMMSACSVLELQVGMISWAESTGQPWTEDWSRVAGGPGAAWQACERALSSMEDGLAIEVRALLDAARPVRESRNKFAHAVFTLDPTRPGDDQWVLRSARDVDFKPMTESEGGALVVEANRLSQVAAHLRQRVAVESQRKSRSTQNP